MIGTPAYTSPEQARGDKTDFRTDIYSLGATFYQLLVGSPPFVADSSMNVLMMHVSEPIRFPMTATGPLVPPQLTGVIRKMMAKKPDDRYLNYNALLLDLDRVEAKLKEEAEMAEDDAGLIALNVKTVPQGTSIPDTQNAQRPAPVTFNRFASDGRMPMQYKLVLALVLIGGVYWAHHQWQAFDSNVGTEQSLSPPAGITIESVRETVELAETTPVSGPVQVTSGDLSQVTVIDSNIEKLDDTTFRVFGSLRNLGTEKVRGVFVQVALKNLFDEVIASRDIEAEPQIILPGEQARFSVLFKNVTDVTAHTAGIAEAPRVEHQAGTNSP